MNIRLNSKHGFGFARIKSSGDVVTLNIEFQDAIYEGVLLDNYRETLQKMINDMEQTYFKWAKYLGD
jgi:hypothetical protein